jgi:PleD family two-component response regulator
MRKKTVLDIDDDVNFLMAARRILQSDGFEVFSHAKAFTATDLARQLRPDVILLDVNPPDLLGEKVFAILQATDSTRDLPVIFCSSGNLEALQASAKRFGARGYLVKGNVSLLRHCVGRLIGERTYGPDRERSRWRAEDGEPG